MQRRTAASVALFGLGLSACTPSATPSGGAPSVIICAAGSFRSGAGCLPTKPCPAGAAGGACGPAAPEVGEPFAEDPSVGGVTEETDFGRVIDARALWQSPRSGQLVLAEVEQLEAVLGAMPKQDADRPRVMRRLADLYTELEAATLHEAGGAASAAEAEKAAKLVEAARAASIGYARRVLDQYPKFCQNTPTAATAGCNDETLYYLGLAYVRGAQLDEARATLLEVIRNWPESRFVPHAYFVFGELFRGDAASDPTRWSLAEQAYLEAARHLDAQVTPAAYLRLAEVYDAKGQAREAAEARAKARR